MFGPTGNPPQVIAHRGASRQCPENTVAAFRRARELRADAVELDVRATVDGVLVVHHDPVLSDGRVISQTHAGALPEHVASLSAALDACEGMWVNVEIKNDPSEPGFDPAEAIARHTVTLLAERSEPASQWLISSFRRQTIDAVRAADPRLPTALLCLEVEPETLAGLAADGHVAVHPWVELLTRDIIAASHGVGLQVNTWTCDDPVRMAELLDAGLDGICTNVPDVARHVVDVGITRRRISGS